MKGKVKCSCGHSWNKSDSSKKDATICHICGKDNTMKDGGWLEKYNDGGPIQPNYNDYSVSAGPGFQGDGYSNVGRNYSPAWGGQFQDGGKLSFIDNPKLRNMLEGYKPGFLETVGDYRLPEGQIIPLRDPSTEVSISVGGGDDEPAYLIPSFKYGQPLQDPVQEFNMTEQYLGGPFKTVNDAETFRELRHQYVGKGQPLPSPIATANMAMGGSIGGATQGIPGATGFMYARTGTTPSEDKGRNKIYKTDASAQKGKKASNQIPKEIPKVTTTKFLPPIIRPDEEVTKPEPEPEPEPTRPTTPTVDPDALTPEQMAKQQAELEAQINETNRKQDEESREELRKSEIARYFSELARKQRLEEQEAAEYRALEGVYGSGVRKAEKELNSNPYSDYSDSRINNYHSRYNKLETNPITKEKVEGVKKGMMDYVNSPLYALRQKNYPEQYNGVDQYVKYIDQDEFQDRIAKEKREARLKQIAKTPFIEISEDDKVGSNYSEYYPRVSLQPYDNRATIAHEYGHTLNNNRYANDEYGNVMKDETGKGITSNDTVGVSSDLYNSKYWDGSPRVGKGLARRLNQKEVDAFVKPAKPTDLEKDSHYDKNQGISFASEQYGDLSGMRQLFLDYGITKSYGEDIDINKINKAKNNKNITTNPLWKRFSNRYSPEDIIRLNNTIAANNPQQGMPVAQNGMEMSYYQNGLDFKPKSISKNGSVIKDDMGQWAHPGEITEIGSNQITMQGVPYPVLGISDTGDTQMMYPNEEYEFIGDSVTEYPMMQNGGWLDSLVDMGKGVVDYVGGLFEDPAPVVKSKASIKPKADTYDTLLDLGFNNPQSAKLKNLYKTNRNKTYLEDKNKVALNTGRFKGANVSAALIDDIAAAAKRNKIPVGQLLALAGRESTFGQQKGNDRAKKDSANNEYMSGWNVAEDYSPYDPHRFLADKKVPGIKTLKNSSGYYYEITDEKATREYLKKNPQILEQYKKKLAATPDIGNRNYFDLSAEFLKKKGIQGYNPGDPTYVDMFNQDYNTLKQDKELMSYLKKKGYRYEQGGQLTKLDQLTNFTNYNTKQPGGWLDKYQ